MSHALFLKPLHETRACDVSFPWHRRQNGLWKGCEAADMGLPTPGQLFSLPALSQGLRVSDGKDEHFFPRWASRETGRCELKPIILIVKAAPPGGGRLEELRGYSGRSTGPGARYLCSSLTV